MKTNMLRQGIVIGIMISFVGVSIVSSIGLRYGNSDNDSRDLNDGLISYWSFDLDSADTTKDEISNHDGTIYGATHVDGISGLALEFDGEGDYIEIQDTSDFQFADESLTYSAWVQIFDNDNQYHCFIYLQDTVDAYPLLALYKCRSGIEQGRMIFHVANADEGGSIVLSTDDGEELPKYEWMHVAGVVDHDEGIINLYINGVSQGTDSLVNFDMDDSGTLGFRLGDDPWDNPVNPGNHHGLLDEVRIYNRALSGREIQELCDNPGGLKPTIVFGRLTDLDSTVGNLATFEAVNIRGIKFSPFEIIRPTAGTMVKISEDYRGFLSDKFIIAICDSNI